LAMDLRKIKKLIEMLEESGLSEIEIKEGEESVRLARIVSAPNYVQPQLIAAAPLQAASAAQASAPAAAKPSEPNPRELPEGNIIRAPMVGSYYSSQAPGQPALAKLGQQIKMGDTIGIIEAMKMFNPIESEFSGTVVKILVENGSPVEFDQALMVIQ
jgi:acetyl-CoA carboxylase biotin carboxyl carrier protein